MRQEKAMRENRVRESGEKCKREENTKCHLNIKELFHD